MRGAGEGRAFFDRWTPWVILGAVYIACGPIFLREVLGTGSFYRAFRRIDPGIGEEDVLRLLGSPDERSHGFRLGQYEGFEEEYARAARSGSTRWLLWHRGIDLVYAVGLDPRGRVTMKAVGGT